MNITRKIVLTSVVTLAVFALGSAGAAAVAHTLTIEDRTGAVQKTSPVTTGTTGPSSNALPFDDKSVDATGTTTVPPIDPMYVDEYGDVRHNGAEDGVTHGVGDDGATHDGTAQDGTTHDGTAQDGTAHDGAAQDSGDTGVVDAPSPSPSAGTSGSSGFISTSDGSDESGSSSGSGDGSGSHDIGGQR